MIHPFDLLVENLRGTIPVSSEYMSKEQAYEELKMISGQDWGYDAETWLAHRTEILARMEPLPQRPTSPQEARARFARVKKQLRKNE